MYDMALWTKTNPVVCEQCQTFVQWPLNTRARSDGCPGFWLRSFRIGQVNICRDEQDGATW